MVDDRRIRGLQDRARINMKEDYEVRYWTNALGVSRDQLAAAVEKVGDSVRAVRQELGKAA
jgi:hypothetical protein